MIFILGTLSLMCIIHQNYIHIFFSRLLHQIKFNFIWNKSIFRFHYLFIDLVRFLLIKTKSGRPWFNVSYIDIGTNLNVKQPIFFVMLFNWKNNLRLYFFLEFLLKKMKCERISTILMMYYKFTGHIIELY